MSLEQKLLLNPQDTEVVTLVKNSILGKENLYMIEVLNRFLANADAMKYSNPNVVKVKETLKELTQAIVARMKEFKSIDVAIVEDEDFQENFPIYMMIYSGFFGFLKTAYFNLVRGLFEDGYVGNKEVVVNRFVRYFELLVLFRDKFLLKVGRPTKEEKKVIATLTDLLTNGYEMTDDDVKILESKPAMQRAFDNKTKPLQQKIEEQLAEITSLKKSYISTAAEQEAQFKRLLADKESEYGKLKSELGAASSKLQDCDSKQKDVMAELDAKRKELDSVTSAKSVEIDELKSQLSKLQEKLNAASQSGDEKQKQLEKELTEKQLQLDQLLRSSEGDVASLRSEVAKLTEELSTATKKISDCQEKQQGLETKLQEKQTELDVLTNSGSAKDADVRKLNEQIAKLTASMESASKKLEDNEVKLQTKQAELENKQKELDSLHSSSSGKDGDITGLTKRIEELSAQLNVLSTEKADLQKVVQDKESEITSVNQAKSDQTEKLIDSRKDTTEKVKLLEQKEIELKELQQQLSDAKNSLNDVRKQAQECNDLTNTLKSQVAKRNAAISQQNTEYERLQTLYRKMEEAKAQLEAAASRHRSITVELENQLKLKDSAALLLENRNRDLEDELALLKQAKENVPPPPLPSPPPPPHTPAKPDNAEQLELYDKLFNNKFSDIISVTAKFAEHLRQSKENNDKGAWDAKVKRISELYTSKTDTEMNNVRELIIAYQRNNAAIQDIFKLVFGLTPKDTVPTMAEQPALQQFINYFSQSQQFTDEFHLSNQKAIDFINKNQAVLAKYKDMDFAPFQNGSKLVRSFTNLFEDISGAVRVIVRFNERLSGGDDQYRIERKSNSDGTITRFRLNSPIPWPDKYNKLVNEFMFGPFYNVSKPAKADEKMTNKAFADDTLNINNLMSIVDQQYNLCLFTYGYSGSGKTFTIFGSLLDNDTYDERNYFIQQPNGSKQLKDENGVLFHMLQRMVENGYKIKMTSYSSVYGWLKSGAYGQVSFQKNNTPLTPANIEMSNVSGMSDFMRGMFDSVHANFLGRTQQVNGYSVDLRGESEDNFIKTTPNNKQSSRGFMILNFHATKEGSKPRNICVVDMAGNEDPIDILIAMTPINAFPSTSSCSTDKSKVAACSNFLQTTDIGDYNIVLRSILAACSQNIKETTDVIARRFKDAVKVRAKSLGLPSSPTGKANIGYTLNDVRNTLTYNPTSDGKDVETSLSYASYFACSMDFINYTQTNSRWPSSGGKADVSGWTAFLRNNSKVILDMFEEQFKAVIARDVNATKVQDTINKCNEFLSNKGINHFLVKYQDSQYTVAINFEQTRFNETCRHFVLKQLLALPPAPTGVSEFLFKLPLQEVMKMDINRVEVQLKTELAKPEKNVEMITRLSLRKYMLLVDEGTYRLSVDSDYEPFLSMQFTHPKVEDPYVKIEQALKFSENVTNNANIVCSLDNSSYKMRYLYADRIIREGYFINQANSELIRFLEHKLEGKPYNVKQGTCVMPVTKFYIEDYNKFDKTMCDGATGESFTGLVPIIQNLVEKDSTDKCKYIMVSTIRKENDAKFRSGAIDSIKLVEELKST